MFTARRHGPGMRLENRTGILKGHPEAAGKVVSEGPARRVLRARS